MGDPKQSPQVRPAGRPGWRPEPARVLLGLQLAGALMAGALAGYLTGEPFLTVIAALLTPILAHGAVLAAGLLVTWLAADRPRDRPGRWLATFVRELPRSMWAVYGLLAWRDRFSLAAPRRRRSPWLASAGSPPPGPWPIILIHCYGGNRGLWSVAAPWLDASGHPVHVPRLHPATGDIDAHVETLRTAIVAAGSDLSVPVHLVGHSMGGLVARAYLRRYGWDGIGAVVTLGTPHRGTPQAWFGSGEAASQMVPDSDWLRRLAGEEPLPPPGQMAAIISRQDNITSTASLQVPQFARRIELSGLGHLSYCLEPRVIALALRVIRGVEKRLRERDRLRREEAVARQRSVFFRVPSPAVEEGQAAGTGRSSGSAVVRSS